MTLDYLIYIEPSAFISIVPWSLPPRQSPCEENDVPLGELKAASLSLSAIFSPFGPKNVPRILMTLELIKSISSIRSPLSFDTFRNGVPAPWIRNESRRLIKKSLSTISAISCPSGPRSSAETEMPFLSFVERECHGLRFSTQPIVGSLSRLRKARRRSSSHLLGFDELPVLPFVQSELRVPHKCQGGSGDLLE